ncbi:MAG: DUF2017 domain-containing protein [Micromonosporaceae bacterium]|nr:DUF2017 domain-containing protein [Micromonosporaceae bacterium]
MSLFRRHGDTCVARFAGDEVAVLRQVSTEVIGLLTDGFDRADPVVERLFPDAYRDDREQADEFRKYTEGDLKTSKIDQAGAILAALPSSGGAVVRLDPEGAEAWLRALNDARLALGIRLGVEDDTDLLEELDEAVMRDPTSARVRQLTMYQYLGVLQESLLEAIVG